MFKIFILLFFYASTYSAMAGVRGETKISPDGSWLVQLQDYPYEASIKVFDLRKMAEMTIVENAQPIVFDNVSKTNCFASSETFVFIQSVGASNGNYDLVLFDFKSGKVLAARKITNVESVACNTSHAEVLLSEAGFIRVLDGRGLQEKRRF